MRQLFCWSTEDVVLISLKVSTLLEMFDAQLWKQNINSVDMLLYDYFKQKLLQQMVDEEDFFTRELALLQGELCVAM